MPNPKLETYKNKATGTVYDFTDADAQSKVTATVDLLKDTTGWLGQNKIPFPYNLSDVSGSGITFTADANGVVDADGTTSGVSSLYFSRRDGVAGNKMLLPAGTWKVVGGKSINVYLSVGYTENNAYKLIGTDIGNGFVFTLTEPTYIQISLDIYSTTVSHEKISPMVCTKEQYDLSPAYAPYHESVEEMLTTKEIILTANSNYGEFLTDNDKYCYKWGKMVKVDLDFKVTTQVPAYTDFISGLPKAQGNTTNGIAFGANNAIFRVYVSTSGGDVKLFNHSQPMAVGTYHVSLIYMSQD